MSKVVRRSLYFCVFVAALAVVAVLARTPDTDRDDMIAKYGGRQAHFVDDGAGGRIHYRVVGSVDAPAIVLIHGGNSSLHTWDALAAKLKDRYRVVSLDLYGHGLTGPNPKRDYSAPAFVDAVKYVLDKAAVTSAVWVGNSMGGWVAWRAALSDADRVCGLALIDASGAQTDVPVKPYLGARLMQSSLGQAILPHFSPRFLVELSLKQTYGDPQKLTEEAITRYWELNRFPGIRQAAVDRANTDREPGKWNDVGTIDTPTLILWGENDAVTPPSHADAFARNIRGSTKITYAGIGHIPMEEAPDQVASDLLDWLDKTASSNCQPHRKGQL
jgi:pimeloyl-ACP methyl ester carboxylesterase